VEEEVHGAKAGNRDQGTGNRKAGLAVGEVYPTLAGKTKTRPGWGTRS
jgi:hypothetical protein